MTICTGQGAPTRDFQDGGCCWGVDGEICPQRLAVDDTGQVYDSDRVLVGSIADAAQSLTRDRDAQGRIVDQLQGVTFACSAALRAIGENGDRITNRAQFEIAWEADAGYQTIADSWETIGKPRNYCQKYGPTEGQCCFDGSNQVTERSRLDATAVTVRSAADGAS